ncbi:MAG: flagellin [Deltaproteobacteria bacterium]|nr:flagellin [Deltaproteobacteria bacterium]
MGSLVINHNSQAINTHRNMLNTDVRLKKSLEHLSSGEKIVRAADSPAMLMISEQLRGQIASVQQAIRNSETGVTMVQTTEAALDEVNKLLISVRQLAIHAANEGANDPNMLAADQFEVQNAIESIDRVSRFAQFGKKKILDGSQGVNGLAAGDGLTFIKATPQTSDSPDSGFEVRITQSARKAQVTGQQPLTKELIDSEVTLSAMQGGRVAEYTTRKGEDIDTVIRNLQTAMDLDGVQVDVKKNEQNQLVMTHRLFGSDEKFVVVSDVAGVLSQQQGIPMSVDNGSDVAGTINGQLSHGKGRILTAATGTKADGLQVMYSGRTPEDPNVPVGRVNVAQNSLVFQIGPNAGQRVSVALPSVSTRTLSVNMPNDSGFRFLNDVDVTTAQGAQDTMKMVEKALDDVNIIRGELGAIQKNAMESNIRSLHIAKEELINSESVIRDADMAEEISEFTRNQIMMQSGIAMLGQANQVPQNVMTLINRL